MIRNKKELLYYLSEDAKANSRKSTKPYLFGDEIWKYIRTMRLLDYSLHNRTFFNTLRATYYRLKLHRQSIRLGFSISYLADIGPGFSIAHYGTIVISGNAKIGKNFRIQENTCIGATNGSNDAAIIGDNVFIGTGAKIIGKVSIANDVAIGANAVVVKSIEEPGTTWGGVPSRKLSNNDSHSNLAKGLF